MNQLSELIQPTSLEGLEEGPTQTISDSFDSPFAIIEWNLRHSNELETDWSRPHPSYLNYI